MFGYGLGMKERILSKKDLFETKKYCKMSSDQGNQLRLSNYERLSKTHF
jgi:hypothetical protein